MLLALGVLAVLTVVAATAVVAAGFLVWLALAVVLGVVELLVLGALLGGQFGALAWVVDNALPVVAVAGLLSLPALYVRPVRDEIRAFRRELGTSGTLATGRHPEIATTARRLASQADLPAPDVYIVNRRRPESYALGGRADGTIVVTRGLIRQLDDRELRAVLAHEVSHLANGDSRVVGAALVPLLVAEHVGADERPSPATGNIIVPMAYIAHLLLWAGLTAITTAQAACCRLGVSALSRGRELAADRGAAGLTGEPGALASALRTLADGRGTPSEDKRVWEASASVLDVLPQDESGGPFGLFRTHPRTERRIERLEGLVAETESSRVD